MGYYPTSHGEWEHEPWPEFPVLGGNAVQLNRLLYLNRVAN